MTNKRINNFIEQGSITKSKYFEGWYYKQVNSALNKSVSFIFGYSTNTKNPHSFIQIIQSNPLQTAYLSFPLDSFKSENEGYRFDNTWFSPTKLILDINHETITCKGELTFSDSNELSSENPYMPMARGHKDNL